MSQGNTVTPVTAMEIGSALWLKVDGALEQRQRLLHYVSPLTSSRLARGPGLLFNKPVPTHPLPLARSGVHRHLLGKFNIALIFPSVLRKL